MDTKNLILIIVALTNTLLAAGLIIKNHKSPINVSFGIFILGAALWSFGLGMFNETLDMRDAEIWAKIYYFASAVIVFCFLLFAHYFPYNITPIDEKKMLFMIAPLLFITVVIFHPTWLIEEATHYEWGNDANEKLSGHLLYIVYFFTYLIWSLKLLLDKFKRSEGIGRTNLLKIIVITLISYIFGITFDLILPLLGNYKLIWIGPYFTLVTIFYVAYLIFYKSQKNI